LVTYGELPLQPLPLHPNGLVQASVVDGVNANNPAESATATLATASRRMTNLALLIEPSSVKQIPGRGWNSTSGPRCRQ
jgi:hypothetical protein